MDLLFTEGINLEKYNEYSCGRSDYVVLEIEIKWDMEDTQSYKKKSNYSKTNYTVMNKIFNKTVCYSP